MCVAQAALNVQLESQVVLLCVRVGAASLSAVQ